MSDLIERQDVIDFLKLTRDSEYKKSMSVECKHKSVIRSKHDAHVAFCDYLIEYVKQVPTHETPSNTLGALDCVERKNGKVFPVESISYLDCSNAMLKMWMDNVVTDGEYNRIMDKLNKKHEEDMRGENE